MGMRSTIAYTNKQGVTKVTSVQWATQLDYNMSLDFASRKPDAKDNARRVGEMFKKITDDYEHISSLDRIPESEHTDRTTPLLEGSEFAVSGAQERDGYLAPKDFSRGPGVTQKARDNFITGYHLDDGIGVSYDERDPGKLTYFYRDSSTGKVVMQEATMGQIRAGTITQGYHSDEDVEAFKGNLDREKAKTRRAAAEKKAMAESQSTTASGHGGGSSTSSGTAGSAHVNPRTGKTGICRAVKDPCPFGGESGADNHYATEDEARAAYEKMQGGSGLDGLRRKK